MLDSIKKFFSSSMSPVEESDPEENKKDIRLAACALLLELAYADEEFTEDEREHLESAIRRQYGLEPTQATKLIGLAEEARVYSDGELADKEQHLMRKISHLLKLEAGYLTLARKRAEDIRDSALIDDE